MEASFYGMEAAAHVIRRPPHGVYAGSDRAPALLMTAELTMLAGHRGPIGAGGGGSLSSWPPFDCYHEQTARGGGVPRRFAGVPAAGAFSVDCLLSGGRHGVDDGSAQLQLRPSFDNINLLHVGKLARTCADIDGRSFSPSPRRMHVRRMSSPRR